jgi:predicted enzyme related to lactoylglutathione lyase
LFGWSAKHGAASAGMEYTEMSNNGQPGVGMMPKPPQMPAHVPSYWMPYFWVENVDASAGKAKQLGGKLMVPPADIPKVGRFSIVGDPQGAVFAIFTPAVR